uniref:Transaldolase n=1 Tax=Solibacter usitatus (strain Ellin6076) TaxID=234267 RepID=Q02BK9_SOLUE
MNLAELKIKIFADGADKRGILDLYRNPLIQGFTTNPTLMRQAGISDYAAFARDILAEVPDRSFSLEVFSDEFEEMGRQARKLAALGPNVFVKIPITNTRGESAAPLVRELTAENIKLNVTALLTLDQVCAMVDALEGSPSAYISVFAGRVADAGIDPVPLMKEALALMRSQPRLELIWASPREIFNLVQADRIGCHIITITHDLLKKLPSLGKDLVEFSLDTVKMFHRDAVAAGFEI